MIHNKLSADPSAMVLAIVGLVLLFLGCCCGLFAIVSLVLGIVALVMANKAMQEFALAPENYSVKSYNNVKTSRVLGIVCIILSGIVLLIQVITFAFFGSDMMNEDFWREFQKNGNWQYEYNSTDVDTTGDWSGDESTIKLKKQGDSIVIDTLSIDTTTVKK